MTAIEVNFLTGRYVATAHHDRAETEWPPHAARLFSAMVAAWAEVEQPDDVERASLEWLESQPPPRISAPPAIERRTVKHYVPVNDARVISWSPYERRLNNLDSQIAERTQLLEDLATQHDKLRELDDLSSKQRDGVQRDTIQKRNSVQKRIGNLQKKLDVLQRKIDKTRDVDSLTGKVGTTNKKSALEMLHDIPDGRVKKERYYPSVTLSYPDDLASSKDLSDVNGSPGSNNSPSSDGLLDSNGLPNLKSTKHASLFYVWDASVPSDIEQSLDKLLSRVTRLGHSSSLVSCRLSDSGSSTGSSVSSIGVSDSSVNVSNAGDARATHITATHIPGEGPLTLRWVRPGQLAALVDEYAQHQAARPRSLPFRGVRYREVDTNRSASNTSGSEADVRLRPDTAGEWIVFELSPKHRRISSTRTVELAQVLRKSILRYVRDPIPEGVSGHLPDGTPTRYPHAAFLALPNVGYERSDGRIMGLAVSLPDGLDNTARRAILSGIGTWERQEDDRSVKLKMGHKGVVKMVRGQPPFALVSLRRGIWAQRSRFWASATPVALPTHPGDLSGGTAYARAKAWSRAEEAVAKSCEHIGLPRPLDVQVSFISPIRGTYPAYDFPVFSQGRDRNRSIARRLVHVSVEFAETVDGPMLLGSGRFTGLGLMRPVVPIDSNAQQNAHANVQPNVHAASKGAQSLSTPIGAQSLSTSKGAQR